MSTAAATSFSTASQELVERVVEVTGSSQAEAEHLLAACANDVEAAVALFFEHGAPSTENSSTSAPLAIDEDDVRAPIAPIREQLIGPEDDNFYSGSPPPVVGRISRAAPRVKVCPLRDFAREGELMEEQLHGNASLDNFGPSSFDTLSSSASSSSGTLAARSRKRARAAAMVASAQLLNSKSSGSSRLGDLFRPPTDIAYAGTFQTARMRATELKHWLLVNVQSDNFESQVLNRDVWSDKEVRKLIRRQFMLWQVDSDSTEGRRFVAFYHCTKRPYICVIDPRTGEEIWRSAEPKQANVFPDLQQFLREHKDFCEEIGDDCPTTSKRSSDTITIDDDDADGENSSGSKQLNKRAKVVELSEEEQIALAIRNSMRENGAKHQTGSDDDEEVVDEDTASLEEFGDDEAKRSCKPTTSYEEHLGAAKDELTMLKLRLINAAGEDEVLQLRWPSDTPLKVIHMYIAQHFPNVNKLGYKLICAFPRKSLEAEDNARTLKQLGLHPSANLHVTLDD